MRSPRNKMTVSERITGRVLRLALMPCCWGILTLLAAISTADCSQAMAQEMRLAETRPMIEWRGDRLSVSARAVPWAEVLHEIQRQTGIRLQVKGPLFGTLTHEFEALPLEQGLRQLFRRANVVFFYTPSPNGKASPARLTQVWLTPRDDAVVPRPDSAGEKAAVTARQVPAISPGDTAESQPPQEEATPDEEEEEEETEEPVSEAR